MPNSKHTITIDKAEYYRLIADREVLRNALAQIANTGDREVIENDAGYDLRGVAMSALKAVAA